jgi:hypothetical protein
MSLRRIAGLLARDAATAVAVLALAAAAAWAVVSAPGTYSESVTVVFTGPSGIAALPAGQALRRALIDTEIMMSGVLVSPAAKAAIRREGGTAPFTVTPFNLYSMQYPDYAQPFAVLTAASPEEFQVRRTFGAALGLLRARLTQFQKQAGVPAPRRVRVHFTAAAPLVRQRGSRVRVFAGLAVLTAVAVMSAVTFLDRRRRQQ